MNKHKRRRKTCQGKIKHESKHAAYMALRGTLKSNFIFHKIHVYKCPYCGFWHLGKSKKIFYDKFDQLSGVHVR